MVEPLEMLFNERIHLIVTMLSFIGAQATILFSGIAFPLSAIGAVCLGVLAGYSLVGWQMNKNPPTKTHTETITELVPYDQWPDKCYICNSEIPDDMSYRGQYVIHKGEAESQTKAVPLCEECTWTYSTVMDNHDQLVEKYDNRGSPVEL